LDSLFLLVSSQQCSSSQQSFNLSEAEDGYISWRLQIAVSFLHPEYLDIKAEGDILQGGGTAQVFLHSMESKA
jgi:hypothetical protein